MRINKEDNLESCPDCGEDMPGGKIRCTRCQREHDAENMTEEDYRAHEALFPSGSAMPQLPIITYTVGVKSVSDMLTQQEQQRYSNAIREAIKTAYPAYDVVVTLDNTIGGADCEVSNDPYGETDIAEHAHSIAHGVWIGAAWLDK
ncbi:hypothetical protein D9Q61_22245 [Salmonella enterica subsp. enterica serovar Enteritidis]|nr:hypothetical protein [Salmonella enterica subsp. enterica serovar Enteritidis]EDA2251728.1 hypothetical protein [Salmonella enterica subsp. enterica serovar Enteritidis]EDD6151641.1 hypothetical protein [Salmonella enterica subsp. enterica serovar Enteritidis]